MGKQFKLLTSTCKGAGQTLAYNYIEDNMNSLIRNNKYGINTVLEKVLQNCPEFEDQLNEFTNNALELNNASYEPDQSVTFLRHLISNLGEGNPNSSFEVRLERLVKQLAPRLVKDIAMALGQSTLPIQLATGLFGSSERAIMSASNEIREFVLHTMQNLNQAIKEKVKTYKDHKQIFLHTNEPTEEKTFQSAVNEIKTQLKINVKKKILSHLYEYILSPKIRHKIQKNLISNYACILNPNTKIVEFVHNIKPEVDSDQVNLQTDDFKTNLFVTFKDHVAVILDTSSSSVDKYLEWKDANSHLLHNINQQ